MSGNENDNKIVSSDRVPMPTSATEFSAEFPARHRNRPEVGGAKGSNLQESGM